MEDLWKIIQKSQKMKVLNGKILELNGGV